MRADDEHHESLQKCFVETRFDKTTIHGKRPGPAINHGSWYLAANGLAIGRRRPAGRCRALVNPPTGPSAGTRAFNSRGRAAIRPGERLGPRSGARECYYATVAISLGG